MSSSLQVQMAEALAPTLRKGLEQVVEVFEGMLAEGLHPASLQAG